MDTEDEKIQDKELPWPKKGDTLFSKGQDDINTTACFFSTSGTLYSTGYKRASDILVEHLRKHGREQDFLVYPIIFMYRQYLELQLKEIITAGRRLEDDYSALPIHHELGLLWKEARKHIKNRWPDSPEHDLNVVEACIKDFVKADPASTAFRYPLDKEGGRSLKDRWENLDIGKFADVMDRISSLLEGSHSGIIEHLDYKREMEREYRADYGE